MAGTEAEALALKGIELLGTGDAVGTEAEEEALGIAGTGGFEFDPLGVAGAVEVEGTGTEDVPFD